MSDLIGAARILRKMRERAERAEAELERLTAENAELQAQVESLQNKWASRPLSHSDGEALIVENNQLRKIYQLAFALCEKFRTDGEADADAQKVAELHQQKPLRHLGA